MLLPMIRKTLQIKPEKRKIELSGVQGKSQDSQFDALRMNLFRLFAGELPVGVVGIVGGQRNAVPRCVSTAHQPGVSTVRHSPMRALQEEVTQLMSSNDTHRSLYV